MTSKKWVFETMVTDDRDAVGLIAYALYKNKKHTLANALRKEGRNEAYIQEQVQTFHDQTLQNNSLEDYREKATNYLNELFQKIEEAERERWGKEKAQLEKEHKKQSQRSRRDFIKAVQEYEKINKPWYKVVGTFLLSGIPGVVATFLLFSLAVGGATFFVSDETKKQIVTALVLDYFGGEAPPQEGANEDGKNRP